MNFTITKKRAAQSVGTLVVPVYEGLHLTTSGQELNDISHGFIHKKLKSRQFQANLGDYLEVDNVEGIKAETVVFVGLGQTSSINAREFTTFLKKAFARIKLTRQKEATLCLPDLDKISINRAAIFRCVSRIGTESEYNYHISKDIFEDADMTSISIKIDSRVSPSDSINLREGAAIGNGMKLARDLANLPPNVCTPTFLAKTMKQLGKRNRFSVKCLSEKDMEKLGMGALLSVSRGSDEPATLIHATYEGGKKSEKPIVLVGKGITFDTGGISLKPSSEMDEMKYDMCGAAGVIGTMLAVSEMRLPINVVGIVASAENMPSGKATRPGDVVTSMSGKTIEILNTDAEGRLVLCDALTYIEKLKPAAAIDIATLTGACVVALGKVATGLFSNNDELAGEISDAGQEAWDRVWQMPVWDDYTTLLKSNFADLANIGGRAAGSITAACFLSEFAKKYPWAHLDIAGTAWVSGKDKGATGRPVPLLCEFLINRASSK
jgi:leucyl aminopeptidase